MSHAIRWETSSPTLESVLDRLERSSRSVRCHRRYLRTFSCPTVSQIGQLNFQRGVFFINGAFQIVSIGPIGVDSNEIIELARHAHSDEKITLVFDGISQ